MSITPFRTPRPTPSSFENYFYQIKPFLGHRPSTPTPISKQFLSKTSYKNHSFHLTSKRSPKSPLKCCTFDLRPLKTDYDQKFDALSSGKLTFMQNPQSRLETEYQSNGNNSQNELGPILQIDYNSPEPNIKKIFKENYIQKNERSPSLVECETEEFFRTQERKEQGFRRITGRDLSLIRLEEKSLQEYIGTVEARIRKCEDEEKSIRKKIDITKKFEEKIFEKRKDVENMMKELNNKKLDKEKVKDNLRQKNQLEKQLHKENIKKKMNKIFSGKQEKALQIKDNKENLMEKANMKKDLDFSEKIIKVNGILNFEKKLKSKKNSNCSQKGSQVQSGLVDQFQTEREKLTILKTKASQLEKQEEVSKAKLEDIKQLHMIKFFKFKQLFENKENLGPMLNNKGFTMASTATFDERKSGNSEIVTFDKRKSGSSGTVHINTSVITLAQKKN